MLEVDFSTSWVFAYSNKGDSNKLALCPYYIPSVVILLLLDGVLVFNGFRDLPDDGVAIPWEHDSRGVLERLPTGVSTAEKKTF